jgi:hypothetical protein
LDTYIHTLSPHTHSLRPRLDHQVTTRSLKHAPYSTTHRHPIRRPIPTRFSDTHRPTHKDRFKTSHAQPSRSRSVDNQYNSQSSFPNPLDASTRIRSIPLCTDTHDLTQSCQSRYLGLIHDTQRPRISPSLRPVFEHQRRRHYRYIHTLLHRRLVQ